MNITFLILSLDTGGVESVTVTLANEFKKKGYGVSIICFWKEKDDSVRITLNKDVPVYYLSGFKYSKENIQIMRFILKENETDVVINQYGLPWIPARIIKNASKGLHVKLVSYYHSDPAANARLSTIDKELLSHHGVLRTSLLRVKRKIVKFVTSRSMKYVYSISDAYMLLSESFFQNFAEFTGVRVPKKLFAMPNPVTLDEPHDTFAKSHTILYVGRVDTSVKRVDRVIEVWRLLEEQFPDWTLKIVGAGEGLEEVKKLSYKYGLKHVHFEGFQSPVDYYKEGAILLLTSDFEGFGLVLIEGMMYGVVPVVYGSYKSVFDIVDNQKNGIIIMPEKGQFPVNAMAEKVAGIMKNEAYRNSMAEEALRITNKYSKKAILSQWDSFIASLRITNN